MKTLTTLFLLVGCAPVPKPVGEERYIVRFLEMCITSVPYGARIQKRECLADAMRLCVKNDLPPNCAEDKFEDNKRE